MDDYDMLPGRVTVAAARRVDAAAYARKSAVVCKVYEGRERFVVRYVSQNPIEHIMSAASVGRMARAAKKAFCGGVGGAGSLPVVKLRKLSTHK